ncbi:MAG: zinc ribbon domain-containing protein [Lachnospiraceae bacterium]|nr:zinc ribbon domain-containing protein [Lachnospiraceae bacterium]
MEMKHQTFCQSCGMPMEGAQYGTEADGRKSTDYCSYCYEGGKFCVDVTMEQMIDFCAKPMADATGMTANDAKAQMAVFFPQLRRWRTK